MWEDEGDTFVKYDVYVDEQPPIGWVPAIECSSGNIISFVFLRVEEQVSGMTWSKRRAAHQWLAYACKAVQGNKREPGPEEFYVVEAHKCVRVCASSR